MTWTARPGTTPEEQLQELEKTFGLQNLLDVQFDEATGILTIFTQTKKFQVTLTEV